jgi:hypothetical protein
MVGERRHRRDDSCAQTLDRNSPAPHLDDRNRPRCRGTRSHRDGREDSFRPVSEEKADKENYETKPDPGHPYMTSLRLIESNRRNAFRSTGPKRKPARSAAFKKSSSPGSTAEIVIQPLGGPSSWQPSRIMTRKPRSSANWHLMALVPLFYQHRRCAR